MMTKDHLKLEALCELVASCAREAMNQNLVYGSSGNFSARDPESGLIALTPAHTPYNLLETDQIPIINSAGDLIEGEIKPSSELEMHLAIFRKRNDIHAIVHTHAPFSLVFAAAAKPIPIALSEAALILGGEVPVAEYQKPGSTALAEAVVESLGDGSAVLLERHGLVTVGQEISHALEATMAVEASARTILLAESSGFELKYFSAQELHELLGDNRVNYQL